MNSKQLENAIQLTQNSLSRFWHKDYQFTLDYCKENVMLIGSLQEQFVQGLDAVRDILYRTSLEQPFCHLVGQEFHVVQNCGRACTIVGRYLVTTDASETFFLQSQQRCTYVWELEGDVLQIKHIHISDPLGELKLAEGEMFANTIGRMATNYYLRHMENTISRPQLTVIGIDNATYFLHFQEIIYVCAMGRTIMIRTISGKSIEGRMSISDFQSIAGSKMILVHRSYTVNPDYVSAIKKDGITMADGSLIPVPAKRYTAIKELLVELHGTSSDHD